jgi:hypothetical protein
MQAEIFIKGVIPTYDNVMSPNIMAKTHGIGMVLLPQLSTVDCIILEIKS